MENKNVPSIRFKGFTDDWEQRKLGEVITNELKGKAKANMDGLKSVYLDAEYLNGGKVCYVDSPTDVSTDDVLILWDGSQAGSVYHGFEGALGSTLKVFKPKYSGDFLYQFLIRNQEKIYNSYRTPNIPHVIKNFTSEFKIDNPKEEEQNKIGNFFKQLDETITLYEREVELLRITKKGFLQQLFPKTNQLFPNI
ncbi:restriction endonuclease subunit S, partial [Vagococcus fluvialis]